MDKITILSIAQGSKNESGTEMYDGKWHKKLERFAF